MKFIVSLVLLALCACPDEPVVPAAAPASAVAVVSDSGPASVIIMPPAQVTIIAAAGAPDAGPVSLPTPPEAVPLPATPKATK